LIVSLLNSVIVTGVTLFPIFTLICCPKGKSVIFLTFLRRAALGFLFCSVVKDGGVVTLFLLWLAVGLASLLAFCLANCALRAALTLALPSLSFCAANSTC